MPSLLKGIKIYRKFRYRKGYGIHSPLIYNLITKVIEEKSPYYVFEKINSIRKNVFEQSHNKERLQRCELGELLFRLVNFFQSKNVLQVGSTESFTSLYLASAHSGSVCVVIEEDKERGKFAEEVILHAGLKNIRVETGSYWLKINELIKKTATFDFIFISVTDDQLCRRILEMCYGFNNNETIIVIDGIHKNKIMRALWQELIKDGKINISIDLYALGVVILKKNTHKQHYKTYFNDGKKQSLHKNRRQRLHLFGRRNKSSQNTYSFRRLWNRR